MVTTDAAVLRHRSDADGTATRGTARPSSVRRNVTVERYDGLALALFACSIDHFS